jgi:hypothetical protein
LLCSALVRHVGGPVLGSDNVDRDWLVEESLGHVRALRVRGDFATQCGDGSRPDTAGCHMDVVCRMDPSHNGRDCNVGGRLVEMALFVVSCAMFSLNVRSGVAYGHYRNTLADAMIADVADDVPPQALALRYVPAIYPTSNAVAARLEMMRSAHTGPYRQAGAFSPVPACHEARLQSCIVSSNQVAFDGDIARGTGNDPFVDYALQESVSVSGVRVHASVDNDANAGVTTQLFWVNSAAGENFDGTRRNVALTLSPGDQTTIFWIYGKIDHSDSIPT